MPSGRLRDLVAAATQVFIARGYRRTQMADIAQGMGLGKGTLYGYVKSKAALFKLVVERCDDPAFADAPADLPLETPEPGSTLRAFQRRMASDGAMPALTRALAVDAPPDGIARELCGILSELYGVLYRNRHGVRLMEACAPDHPELAGRWHDAARYAYLDRIERYLVRRAAAGALILVAEPRAVGRFLIETVATWAVHIHFDRAPQAIPNTTAERIALHFLTTGLLCDAKPTGAVLT
jgi:AcrR family transcriptional regulator